MSKARLQKLAYSWPSIALLIVLVAYPLGSILLQSVFPQLFDAGFTGFTFSAYSSMLKNSYTYKSILDALLIGGGVSILATVAGTLLAVAVHRHLVIGHKVIQLLVWLTFFAPSYLIAEGWVLSMQHKGILSELFGLPNGKLDWFFTIGGVIVAMALKLFPVVYLSVQSALQGLGSEFEEAARTVGAGSLRVWLRINIPLLMPAILAGGTLTFAETVSDFGFAAAIVPKAHIPLLTYSIYTALGQMPVNFSQVGALSVVLIGIIAFSLWLQKRILGKGSYSIINNQIRPMRQEKRVSLLWSSGAYLFFAVAFVLPMCGVMATSVMKNVDGGFGFNNFTWSHYQHVLASDSDTFQALWRSLELSFATAVVATLLGFGLAFVICHMKGRSTQILYVLTMSTVAIPGIVLAAGLVFAWNAPYLVPFGLNLYGTMFCLFLAYMAGALPNSIRLQIAAIQQINPSLLNAGQVHGANLFVIFKRILLPLVSTTAVSTFFLMFSHIMFELPASQLLFPPGQEPLPVVIQKYYTNLDNANGAASTMLAVAVVLFCYGVGQWLLFLWKKGRVALAERQSRELNTLLQRPSLLSQVRSLEASATRFDMESGS